MQKYLWLLKLRLRVQSNNWFLKVSKNKNRKWCQIHPSIFIIKQSCCQPREKHFFAWHYHRFSSVGFIFCNIFPNRNRCITVCYKTAPFETSIFMLPPPPTHSSCGAVAIETAPSFLPSKGINILGRCSNSGNSLRTIIPWLYISVH